MGTADFDSFAVNNPGLLLIITVDPLNRTDYKVFKLQLL